MTFSHLPDLYPAIAELARVVQAGGRVVISAPHPFVTGVLGGRAPVIDIEGNVWAIPEYEHWHEDYIQAFRRAGLEVLQCIEPRLTPALSRRWNPLPPETGADRFDDAFGDALAGQPAVLVWEVQKPDR